MEGKTTVRIASVGDLGGATTYFSSDNAVGFYHWLRDRISEGKAPDHIVFHGGAIPEFPPYSTKSGLPKNLVLDSKVRTYDDAVSLVTPHLSRITELIKEKQPDTGITYIMGDSDQRNMQNEYDRALKAYKLSPKQIIELRDAFDDRVVAIEKKLGAVATIRDKNIETLNAAREKLREAEKHHASAKEITRLKKGVDNYRKRAQLFVDRVAEKTTELEDYKGIRDLYGQLFVAWSRDNDVGIERFAKMFDDKFTFDLHELYKAARGSARDKPVPLEQLQAEAVEELEWVKKQMAKTDPNRDKAEFARLSELSRTLENHVEKLSHKNAEVAKKNADAVISSRMAQVERFTGNISAPRDVMELANQIARKTIEASIGDAFGRNTRINVVASSHSTIKVKGLDVVLTNQRVVSPGQTGIPKEVESMLPAESAGLLRGGSKHDNYWTLVLGANSPEGIAKIKPKRNRDEDHSVYYLNTPRFIDNDKAREAYASGGKTVVTRSATNPAASSGFDEVEFDGYGFSHSFYTAEALRLYADKEKAAQTKVIAAEIRKMTPNSGGSVPLTASDMVRLDGQLPQELRKNEYVQQLLVSLGVDVRDAKLRRELADRVEKMDFEGASPQLSRALEWFKERLMPSTESNTARTENFLLLTDVHTGGNAGGYPNMQLLHAASRYIMDNMKKPFVLAMLGDEVEGNLADHKNEAYKDRDPMLKYEFMKFLKSKGIEEGSPEFIQNVNEYLALQKLRDPQSSADDQRNLFLKESEPLIAAAKRVVVWSGNHFNDTFANNILDEAKFLGGSITLMRAAHKKDAPDVFPGGKGGSEGEFELDGLQVKGGHKINANTELGKLWGDQAVTLGGHIHEHTVTIAGNKIVMTGAPMQGITRFPETIGIQVSESLRGLSTLSVTYSEKGTPLVFTDSAILLKQLRADPRGYVVENPLIREFETSMQKLTDQAKVRSKSFA